MPFHLSPIATTNTSGNILQQHASTIACNTPPPLSTLKLSRFNASTYTHFPKHTKQTLNLVNLANHFVKNAHQCQTCGNELWEEKDKKLHNSQRSSNTLWIYDSSGQVCCRHGPNKSCKSKFHNAFMLNTSLFPFKTLGF